MWVVLGLFVGPACLHRPGWRCSILLLPGLDAGAPWGGVANPSGTSTLWCHPPGLSPSRELCNPPSLPWHSQSGMDVCKILMLNPSAAASTESSSEETPCEAVSHGWQLQKTFQAAILIISRAPRMCLSPGQCNPVVVWV